MGGKTAIASRPVLADAAEPGARAFVWATWALLTALTLAFVARFGPDLPRWDDFDVVDVVAGEHRATVEWLWSLHNEHRVPLPRLVLLGLYRLSGNDFRAGMFFNVAALAALAAGSVAVAARLRGGSRTHDAVFPLVMLGAAHHVNLLWSWQVQFVLSTVAAGAIILLIVSHEGWPSPRGAAMAGLGLAALPLCGANGLALVPALACWLLVAAVARGSSGTPRGRRDSLVALISVAPALFLVGLYLLGLRRDARLPGAVGIGAAMRTSLQFLALMFGPAARDVWPASGVVAMGLVALSAAVVARAAWLGPAAVRPAPWASSPRSPPSVHSCWDWAGAAPRGRVLGLRAALLHAGPARLDRDLLRLGLVCTPRAGATHAHVDLLGGALARLAEHGEGARIRAGPGQPGQSVRARLTSRHAALSAHQAVYSVRAPLSG